MFKNETLSRRPRGKREAALAEIQVRNSQGSASSPYIWQMLGTSMSLLDVTFPSLTLQDFICSILRIVIECLHCDWRSEDAGQPLLQGVRTRSSHTILNAVADYTLMKLLVKPPNNP